MTLPPLKGSATLPEIKPDAEIEQLREYRPDARPKAKAKPVPVVVLPEEPFGAEKPVVVAVPASRHPLHWQELWKAIEAKENQSKRPAVPEAKF